MEISVIIPVYNAERFIEKAVESAISQDETAEVLLVEDKSTDSSIAICEKLVMKYEKVKLLHHPDKQNHGAAAARNLGMANASFQYLSFLDADDFYLPNRFKETALVFETHENADGVYEAIGTHAYDKIGEKLHYTRMIEANVANLNPELTSMTKVIDPNDLFKELCIGKFGWFHFNGLTLKRKCIDRSGFLLEELTRYGEDNEFFLRLAYKCKLYPGKLDVPVAMRGVYAENVTVNYKEPKYLEKTWMGTRFVSKTIFNIMLNNKYDKSFNRFITNRYLDNYSLSIQRNRSLFFRKFHKSFYLLMILFSNPKLITKII